MEWSVAERRKFSCGAAPSGGRRGGFCQFAIGSRSQIAGIERRYANPVVADEDVSEDNAFHLFSGQLVC